MTSPDERDILDINSDTPASAPVTGVDRPVVDARTNAAFLSEFLSESDEPKADDRSEKTADAETTNSPSDASEEDLQAAVIEALKEIYDPEIPVNIYELGLIYEVNVKDDKSVDVIMTLTTPHCPVAESMPGEVELRVSSVPGVMGAEVKLVWEPAWDMSRMSDEARLELGLL